MNNKIPLILKREYLSRVTKKSFILTTLLVPVGLALLPVIIFFIGRSDTDKIAVVDESGLIKDRLQNSRTMHFVYESRPLDSLKALFTKKSNDYAGILYVPPVKGDAVEGIRYFSSRSLGFNASFYLQSEIAREVEKNRLAAAGLTQEFIDRIKQRPSIETIILTESGEKADNKIVAFVTAFIMGIIIYVTLIVYGVMVMNGVVEEKANRIMEVVVSSVRPFEMLMGKILGIALVGMTQLVGWVVISGVLFQVGWLIFGGPIQPSPETLTQSGIKPQDAQAMAAFFKNIDSINFTELFLLFIFYFFGGYLFYAALYAAAASGANDPGDVQSLSFPVTIPVIASFILLQYAVNVPNGAVAFWTSIIPFTSPIVMLGRLPFGVPWWQIALSMALLIGGFVTTTWVASRIYRVGILMYGKKVTLKEVARWMFVKV